MDGDKKDTWASANYHGVNDPATSTPNSKIGQPVFNYRTGSDSESDSDSDKGEIIDCNDCGKCSVCKILEITTDFDSAMLSNEIPKFSIDDAFCNICGECEVCELLRRRFPQGVPCGDDGCDDVDEYYLTMSCEREYKFQAPLLIYLCNLHKIYPPNDIVKIKAMLPTKKGTNDKYWFLPDYHDSTPSYRQFFHSDDECRIKNVEKCKDDICHFSYIPPCDPNYDRDLLEKVITDVYVLQKSDVYTYVNNTVESIKSEIFQNLSLKKRLFF